VKKVSGKRKTGKELIKNECVVIVYGFPVDFDGDVLKMELEKMGEIKGFWMCGNEEDGRYAYCEFLRGESCARAMKGGEWKVERAPVNWRDDVDMMEKAGSNEAAATEDGVGENQEDVEGKCEVGE
jgi:hypothetical protein